MVCTKVAIAGVSSEVGKTTLLCELLRECTGWEAIKITRGHYRSCGKDPHACCVSHLLSAEPVIRSGFQQTYVSDKDTGRYWEAGAANVHWVIVTDDQVEEGIQLALERIKAPGVLIEGNSFLRFIDVDFTVLVSSAVPDLVHTKIKKSTRWAFQKASALYVHDRNGDAGGVDEIKSRLSARFGTLDSKRNVPVYMSAEFSKLAARMHTVHSTRRTACEKQGR